MTENILSLKNVNTFYGESQILRSITMEIPKFSITALMGRNGVGKTTLLKTLMGILACKGGNIYLNGVDITKQPPSQRTKAGLGYVPQGREIFPKLTVDENLKVGLQARTDGLKKVPENKIFSLFPDLQQMGNRMGGNLSGGQQQQLAISRALIGAPSVLILDEPTEGIQPSIIQSIEKVLVELKKQGELTIILVEQYFDFAWEIADYFYLMDRGTISLSGSKDELSESEVKKYLTF